LIIEPMIDDGLMIGAQTYVLAGLVVGRPWKPSLDSRGSMLPATVLTVSECLTDLLEPDGDPSAAPWHMDLRGAMAGTGRCQLISMLSA
jgi:hypothetical protein